MIVREIISRLDSRLAAIERCEYHLGWHWQGELLRFFHGPFLEGEIPPVMSLLPEIRVTRGPYRAVTVRWLFWTFRVSMENWVTRVYCKIEDLPEEDRSRLEDGKDITHVFMI